jgi:hypothetical protein
MPQALPGEEVNEAERGGADAHYTAGGDEKAQLVLLEGMNEVHTEESRDGTTRSQRHLQ